MINPYRMIGKTPNVLGRILSKDKVSRNKSKYGAVNSAKVIYSKDNKFLWKRNYINNKIYYNVYMLTDNKGNFLSSSLILKFLKNLKINTKNYEDQGKVIWVPK
jgi:hypothetical protein